MKTVSSNWKPTDFRVQKEFSKNKSIRSSFSIIERVIWVNMANHNRKWHIKLKLWRICVYRPQEALEPPVQFSLRAFPEKFVSL